MSCVLCYVDNICYHHLSDRRRISLCNTNTCTCILFPVVHNVYIVRKIPCTCPAMYFFYCSRIKCNDWWLKNGWGFDTCDECRSDGDTSVTGILVI